MVPMIFGMIIGPFLRWGNDDLLKLLNRLKILVFLFLFSSILLWYVNFGGPVIAIIFFIFAAWIIIASLFELTKFMNFKPKLRINSLPAKYFSQSISHIGIGLIIIGATGSSILKIEKIQFQEIGEIVKINQYDVEFKGVKVVEGPNFLSQTGVFEVSKDDAHVINLKPEKLYKLHGWCFGEDQARVLIATNKPKDIIKKAKKNNIKIFNLGITNNTGNIKLGKYDSFSIKECYDHYERALPNMMTD